METYTCDCLPVNSQQLHSINVQCNKCHKEDSTVQIVMSEDVGADEAPGLALFTTRGRSQDYETDEEMDTQHQINNSVAAQEMTPLQQPCAVADVTALNPGTVTTTGGGKKKLQGIWYQIFACVAVSIASIMVGFSNAYTSPALASMSEPNSTLKISPSEESWIGSLMPLSALVGGIFGGVLIECVGRRTVILLSAGPFIVAWVMIAFAGSVIEIFVGRVVSGFAVGLISLALPVYIGETTQPEIRGMLNLASTILGNTGILLCFVIGMFLKWTHLALCGSIIALPLLVLTFVIPETPRWYISKGNFIEAKKALMWLRGGKEHNVDAEFEKIEKNHQESMANSSKSMMDLFNKVNIKPLLISIGLMVFQQCCGINVVIFYTVKIFEEAGTGIDKNLSAIVVGVVNLVSTFLGTALIERLGRRVLLCISAIVMAVSLAGLGTFFYLLKIQVDVDDYGWLPLVCCVFFVVSFSVGYGPIPWMMLGEIFPSRIRSSAASLAASINWACAFLVTKTFSDLQEKLGTHGVFWLFSAVCAVNLFFVIFYVPETRGKTLEDIEKGFMQKTQQHARAESIGAPLQIMDAVDPSLVLSTSSITS